MPPPSSRNNSKRKRQPSRATKTRARGHSGPGPPPASLLHLLRDDPEVVDYFQALQASLERDVQIQKDRAQVALAEQKRLQAELDQWQKSNKTAKNGDSTGNQSVKQDVGSKKVNSKIVQNEEHSESEEEDHSVVHDEHRPRQRLVGSKVT